MTKLVVTDTHRLCGVYECTDRAQFILWRDRVFRTCPPLPHGRGVRLDICGTHLARWDRSDTAVIKIERNA